MSHFALAVFLDRQKEEDLDELLAPYDENLEVEEYWDEEYQEKTTYNPDSKWDWYSIGGRFSEMIPLKKGGKATIAKVKEIDFGVDKKAYEKAKRFWEVVVDGEPLKEGEKKEDFSTIWKTEYYTDTYGDKEYFATHSATFVPYAYLSAETGWQEPGEMGWFGCSSETEETKKAFDQKFMEFINRPETQEKFLVIVDCHI